MQKKKTYSPDALRNLSVLEGRLDYRFRDIYLLASALTHSSWANEHNTQHNERLECLVEISLHACLDDQRLFADVSCNQRIDFIRHIACKHRCGGKSRRGQIYIRAIAGFPGQH